MAFKRLLGWRNYASAAASAAMTGYRYYKAMQPRKSIHRRLTTRMRYRRSRTKTITRRKRRPALRFRRRGGNRTRKFNMNGPVSRIIRFKNITEATISYTLSSSAPTTAPVRIQTGHTDWMAPPGTNPMPEALWDQYYAHKLLRYSWKMTNFRIFIETRTTMPAVGSAPAVTDVQISEVPEWTFWYWRQRTEQNPTPPSASDESMMVKFVKRHCRSHIWGKVPCAKNTRWLDGRYSVEFDRTTGTYKNMDTFLKDVGFSAYGITETESNMPCADIHLMPDDPFPSTFYSETGVTRVVKMTIMYDYHSYATWNAYNPRSNPLSVKKQQTHIEVKPTTDFLMDY